MKRTVILITAAAAFGLVQMTQAGERTCAYAYDKTDHHVKNSYGECLRTSTWSPAKAQEECDPQYFAKEEPAPSPPPPPPKPVFEKVTLQADAHFDFDSAKLKPEGTAKLDEIVAKMKRYPEVELIRVTGYADRIGSEDYNLKLSGRRAQAVKDYLVSQGISPDRIEVMAKGEADPVVTCEGVRGRKALIECLAPNRRVEIEIVVQRPIIRQR